METTEVPVTRLFTPAEAEAMIPSLQISLAAIGQMRAEIERLLTELAEGDPARIVEVLRGEEAPRPGREDDLARVRTLVLELGQTVEGIAAQGVIIKDLEPGLLDFPTLHEGRLALLCWQFGEPHVSYWHAADEGFEERRRLSGAAPVLQ